MPDCRSRLRAGFISENFQNVKPWYTSSMYSICACVKLYGHLENNWTKVSTENLYSLYYQVGNIIWLGCRLVIKVIGMRHDLQWISVYLVTYS